MSRFESLARQLSWAGPDTARNLDYIPDDKLDWKPAPAAKSALEIVNHVAGFALSMVPVLRGAEWRPPAFTPATTRAEAQSLLTQATEEYAAALREVKPESLDRMLNLPTASFPLAEAIAFPVVDMIHHRGQIAYIQTLLGDTEDHFLR
jgi:uncharacterized damage-inducible protein DinB